ncbi:MAG: cytochrome b/b6 domain-containing protein [Armatimonadetes bacterium]|nr:cytochrome b/b6 domain-containing protein [Armatimonadota bacterium]
MARLIGRICVTLGTLAIVSVPLFYGIAKAQSVTEPPVEHAQLTAPDKETQEQIDECMGCHAPEAESGPPVKVEHLLKSPHASLGCRTCHSGITEVPHTEEMVKELPKCADCHPDEEEKYLASVHNRPDKVKGDHPRCVTCHGGGDPHSVKLYATWTRQDKVEVCSKCHADKVRMGRYGPKVEAVSSYDNSFHGRALLKYGSQKTAICVDCHGTHGVLQPSDPNSSTSTGRVSETCGKCHPGAGTNFAISGSNHMDLTIHEQPILSGVLLFFKLLVGGMATFLMMGVVLDLKRSLFGKHPPKSGRLIGTIVSFGFMSLVVAIAQAAFGWPGGKYSTILGISLLVVSVIIHKVQSRKLGPKPKEVYDRYHRSIRIQHMVLVIAFTLLILTGMPVRNPETDSLRRIYLALGGLEVGRAVHHAAGVALIGVFLFHVGELLWKWKSHGFKFSSWSMLPNKQDVLDFFEESKSYVLGKEPEVSYGRFHFREKLDYFAEYWGVPLMVITGLILWFPVFFGNFLPPIAIPIAFIAHSYEAVLAFIAILTWHLYNSYFNPNHFALANPWSIGLMSHENMEHKHPLELEQALSQGPASPEDIPGDPEE